MLQLALGNIAVLFRICCFVFINSGSELKPFCYGLPCCHVVIADKMEKRIITEALCK